MEKTALSRRNYAVFKTTENNDTLRKMPGKCGKRLFINVPGIVGEQKQKGKS